MVFEVTQDKHPDIRASCVLQWKTSVEAPALLVAGFLSPMNIKKRTEEINKVIDFHIEAKDYLPTLATYFLILSTEKGLRPNIAAQLAQMSYEMLCTGKYYQITAHVMPEIPASTMATSAELRPSSNEEKGSNNRHLNNCACFTARSPLNLIQQMEPNTQQWKPESASNYLATENFNL